MEERGAECSPAPQDGETPLHYASRKGCLDVVEALLAKGADVQAKDRVSIARACSAPSVHLATFREYSRVPLLLSLETALRLQGLSAIANTRLGQSGSGPQLDTVHNMSLQRVQGTAADPRSEGE